MSKNKITTMNGNYQNSVASFSRYYYFCCEETLNTGNAIQESKEFSQNDNFEEEILPISKNFELNIFT